ncbi:MAG: PQQ-binding-like beta-propeller repeat protein [Planctomycetes bacterium]|nr:PQQ-binding-like beta-propeller repeat protein [Planctomycetota bacterium]
MTSRRALLLPVAAVLVAGCAGRPVSDAPRARASGSDGAYAGAANPMAEAGERLLEGLPWSPDVYRVNLGAALTQVYAMSEDILAVDSTGKVYCLSRRELSAKWVSSLRSPLSAPPAESPTHYVFVERDAAGACWLEWFSKRSGAAGDRSPVRLPFSASSGVAATAGMAFVGSLGSSQNNKTLETVNLADGTPGWSYRTLGRVVATPVVDPTGEVVLVASEDRTFTSLPTRQSGLTPTVNWVSETTAANTCAPAVTKDWAFLGSDDNLLRGYDIHSGSVNWLKGLDAPIRKTPWVVGRAVTKTVTAGGEGAPATKVESFEGYVFARNATGLHCFVATTGEDVFKDAGSERPLMMHGDWVVTIDAQKTAQLRKGKGLPVVRTADFGMFDFLPTNGRDGQVIAGYADGTLLLASPK